VLDKPVVKVPKFAAVSDNESSKLISNECNSEQLLELNPNDGSYPVPKKQKIPKQVGGTSSPRRPEPVGPTDRQHCRRGDRSSSDRSRPRIPCGLGRTGSRVVTADDVFGGWSVRRSGEMVGRADRGRHVHSRYPGGP
jgi:hypothetical protein